MGTGENRDVVYLMKQACNKDMELTMSAQKLPLCKPYRIMPQPRHCIDFRRV